MKMKIYCKEWTTNGPYGSRCLWTQRKAEEGEYRYEVLCVPGKFNSVNTILVLEQQTLCQRMVPVLGQQKLTQLLLQGLDHYDAYACVRERLFIPYLNITEVAATPSTGYSSSGAKFRDPPELFVYSNAKADLPESTTVLRPLAL